MAQELVSCGLRALEHAGFSICGTWAELFGSMWNVPRPGIIPMSPALAGGFLSTVPPGKSLLKMILVQGI